MSVLLFKRLKYLKANTLGLGGYIQKSSLFKFGYSSTYFTQNRQFFKFFAPDRVDLTFSERLVKFLNNLVLSGGSTYGVSLTKQTIRRIELLKFNRSWRGVRHIYSLPVRGQRTKTNARTRKSRRKKNLR